MLVSSHVLVGLALFGTPVFNSPVWSGEALNVEVFTAVELPVTGAAHERTRAVDVRIYIVDGLDRFESGLSAGLSSDPEAAKSEALHRIQQLNDASMMPAKSAAIGLAKAIQYGVDRYPAIVFDERAVVYGVTDLVEALNRYEAWHREHAQ